MSTLKVNNIQDTSGGATTLVSATNTAKAWVNFDGTQAAASMIRASYNVTSMTDSGTGRYIVNFTTAFADVNYVTLFSGDAYRLRVSETGAAQTTTTSARLDTFNSSNASADVADLSVTFFR